MNGRFICASAAALCLMFAAAAHSENCATSIPLTGTAVIGEISRVVSFNKTGDCEIYIYNGFDCYVCVLKLSDTYAKEALSVALSAKATGTKAKVGTLDGSNEVKYIAIQEQ